MKRFQNILFVNRFDNNETALAHALALAKDNEADLTFMQAPEEIPTLSDYDLPEETEKEVAQAALTGYREKLEHLAQPHSEDIDVEVQVVVGKPFLTIIREVLRNDHDLVIKSAEGSKGIASRLFGTTDMRLLRKCPCPIWLVKADQPIEIKRIVAAVDFDPPGTEGENFALNKQILEMAISLAHKEGAKLHVVHVWQAAKDQPFYSLRSSMPDLLVMDKHLASVQETRERRLARLLEKTGIWVGEDIYAAVRPSAHVIRGRASKVISEQTHSLKADLLVMGTIGRTGIPGFIMGNTSETILDLIDCSVLAVKPAGFISPVELPKEQVRAERIPD